MNVFELEHIIDDELHALVQKLDPKLQDRVYKQFSLLMEMPLYPSLHLKKVKGQKNEQWSIYISRNYRALGYENEGVVRWYWIGHHSEYDKILAS